MVFTKAVKTKQWLRLAVDGISGSGKTYTALATASGMSEAMKGKIALIDSEHGSASLYADRFEFDTLSLQEFQIENYTEALNAAATAGYDIVIIDSTSHAWDALVERVERIAHQRFSGNTFRAWAEGTPLQKKLIEAMLTYPGHLIVTCRSKTEYSVDKDDKGKTTIKKVGTAAVQRQGFEYEFTMAMTMDANHVGMVTKDRTGKFQDKFIEKPGKDFGKQLIAWLNEGATPTKVIPPSLPFNPSSQVGEKPKNERQIIVDRIVAVALALTPDHTNFFTDEEKDSVKAKIKATGNLGDLEILASVWETELAKRQKEYKPIPFGDDDLSALSNENKETSTETTPKETVVETTVETESTTTASSEPEPFVDDIPEMGTPKKGKDKAKAGELDIH
jgi:hypothetical protein